MGQWTPEVEYDYKAAVRDNFVFVATTLTGEELIYFWVFLSAIQLHRYRCEIDRKTYLTRILVFPRECHERRDGQGECVYKRLSMIDNRISTTEGG